MSITIKTHWPTAVITAASNSVPAMMVATLGIALPDVRGSLLLSEVEAGALFSAVFTIAALSSTFAGGLADRIGSKTVLISGLTLLAAGFALAGLAGNKFVMFLFLSVTGLGYGFIATSIYTLVSDIAPQNKGLAASFVAVAYGIGGGVGSVLASRVIAAKSWHAAFLMVGAIGAAAMILQVWKAPRHHRRQSSGQPVNLRRSLTPALILLAVAELLGGSVFWSTASWAPTLLRDAKELSLAETGWVMGVWSIAQIFGALALGGLSDRFGRKFVILLSAFPAALMSVVVYQWFTSPASLALGLLLFGALRASAPTLVVALAQETTTPANRGAATGVIMALHYVAAVVTPLVAAQLIVGMNDIISAMILVTAIPMVVYACLIAAVRERSRGDF